MQRNIEVLNGLVVGYKREGRCRYDPQVKQELIGQCTMHGVSVASMAMKNGVNANLRRTWITRSQSGNTVAVKRAVCETTMHGAQTFVPGQVQVQASAYCAAIVMPTKPGGAASKSPAAQMRIQVQLPNKISVDLGQARMDELSGIMQMLSHLPCSRWIRAESCTSTATPLISAKHQRAGKPGRTWPRTERVCASRVCVRQPTQGPHQNPGARSQRVLAAAKTTPGRTIRLA